MLPRFQLAIAFLVLTFLGAKTEAIREIKWQDLIPPKPAITDPLQKLQSDQQYQVVMIGRVRDLQAEGSIADGDQETRKAEEFRHKLEREGLDVDRLLKQREAFLAAMEKWNEQLVDELDGQLIRMPGYLLPLEYTGTAVSEFLLVPFVGACIHVPPPPLNQIVFVHVDKPFRPKFIFTPVRVTGRISTKRTQKTLSFVDGSANVETGYFLRNGKVETFDE